MWGGRRRVQDQLSDYWNALERSAPPQELARLAERIEPDVRTAIERTRGLHRRRRPDPAFASRLETDLMSAFAATPAGTIPLPKIHPGPSNGRSVPAKSPWLPDIGIRRKRARWALASLAAALIIMLAGIGSYLAYDRFGPGDKAPAVIPAVIQEATPITDVSTYRGDPARTGVMPGPGPEGSPVELWRFQTGGAVGAQPMIAGNTVVVSSDDGNIYAIDRSTGGELWRYATGDVASTMPIVSGGVVYAATPNGYTALDLANGETIWQNPTVPTAPPSALVDGAIYVAASDGVLHALDASTGDEIWTFSLGEGGSRSVAVDNGIAYVGSLDGVLHAVDTGSGQEIWKFGTGAGALVFSPTVANGVVYSATGQEPVHIFFALDAATGAELWRLDYPDRLRLAAVSDDALYASSESGLLVAIDLATREQLWSFQTGNTIGAAPDLAGGTVYACTVGDMCFAIDAATGQEQWQLALDGEVGWSPAVTGGVLYVGTSAGSVYAIGGQADDAAAASPEAGGEEGTAVATPAESAGSGFDASQVSMVWESTGSESNPLSRPEGIAIAPDGSLYVSNANESTIEVFAPDGTHLETWGEPGSGPGQFLNAEDIGFDADGNVYVFDMGNYRVQKFAPDRTFLLEWGSEGTGNGQFDEIHGAVDPIAGRVYVAEFLSNRIQVFDLDGNFLDKWGSPGNGPGQFTNPTVIAFDGVGNVYVGEASEGSGARIQKFDQFGTLLAVLGSDELPADFSEVWGIAFDAQGNLYASDYFGNRIQVFDKDLALIGSIEDVAGAGPFNHPCELRFNSEGFLYVADFDNNRVLKLQLPDME